MGRNKIYIVICLSIFFSTLCCYASAQDRKAHRDRVYNDSISVPKNYHKNVKKYDNLYDTVFRSQSKFAQLIAPLLITPPNEGRHTDSTDSEKVSKLEIGRLYFGSFSGRQISQINVHRINVFMRDSSERISKAEQFVDRLHKLTKESVIRKNLLFKVGGKVVPYTMAINEELLRSLPYLANAYFILKADPDSPNDVIVDVFTRDNWTISGTFAWSRGDYVELFDQNFIGTGNNLLTRYYYPRGSQRHGAEMQYQINNLWGTFTNISLAAGVGATNNTARIEASRPFILPSDHVWGFKAGYSHQHMGLGMIDTSMIIQQEHYSLWYGYSWNIDPVLGTAFYGMISGSYNRFNKRPLVFDGINPSFYNRITALGSIGFSRQNYFQGNMIYGYGRTEDVSYGYKFELVGGYEWNEFSGKRPYVGVNLQWADMIGSSYFGLTARAGSFIGKNQTWEQGVAHTSLQFFSPLFRIGRFHLRQFADASITWGIGRTMGEQEQLSFNSLAKMYGTGIPHNLMGHNRAALNLETVLFTPLFFYHFRFAFFLWGDIGVLGYENMFKNQLSSVVGIGVRIKNERLIFNNIQIRFGVMLRQPDGYNFDPFSVSNEEELRRNSFRPEVPQIIPYQ